MLLKNAKVPPFNSTLMGLVKGVADYYKLPLSDAMIYGGSGHSFMMNIHESLCPSGPYCWNRVPFYAMLPNIGVAMKDEGFFSNGSTQEDRARIDAVLMRTLTGGDPCGLVNMEYQLISGFDDTGFITSQPWPQMHDFPPKHLTQSTWAELGTEIHINFFTFKKVEALAEKAMIVASLKHALDIYEHPAAHTSSPFSTGAGAYDAWMKAVEAGHGTGHGNWWNATVWGECRSQASSYFAEIARRYPQVADVSNSLCAEYKFISDQLVKASDKEMVADMKVALLAEAKAAELRCIGRMGEVVSKM